MGADSLRQTVLFPDIIEKPVVAAFDTEHVTSDAGAIFLRRADKKLGLVAKLAACIDDRRAGARVEHSVEDLLRFRILGLACGYSDCNDAQTLRRDPVMKMCASRSPTGEDVLASQPTLSRFENSVTSEHVVAMQATLAEAVVASCRKRYGKKVRRIVIDLDPTDDPTYGSQQLTFFNAFYDNWCYLPLMGFLSFDDHPEQHIFAAMLRPGNAKATLGAAEIVGATVKALHRSFPKARVRVRLDGAFATGPFLDFLEGLPRTEYAVNLPKNVVLKRFAEPLMVEARAQGGKTGATAAVFGEFGYEARKWKGGKRRIVVKAEVTRTDGREPRDNPRFVVTNIRRDAPETVYDFYRDRGNCENRIKEMKLDLDSGRTSCTSFQANQLRLIMSAAAFVLIQELRADAAGTEMERATVGTIRCRLLKIGARVVESVRRVVLHLPTGYPWQRLFAKLAAASQT